MMLSIHLIQNWSQMRTKSHCINNCNDSLYAQQHPTRLGKQLHPQTVGLLVSRALENITIRAGHL